MSKKSHIMLGCCAVFFCAASAYAQGYIDTCAHLREWAAGSPQTEAEYQKQYDMLRMYIERCAVSDSNYWGGASNGNSGDAVVGTGITFTHPSAHLDTWRVWSGSISCSGGFTIIEPKGNNPLSVEKTLGVDTCIHLKSWMYDQPQSPQEFKEQYDTLRLFIEKCAASDSKSWEVFTTIDGAVQSFSDDTTRFDTYRNWLISVLYLNTINPEYFCECMGSIPSTYQEGSIYHHVQNASLAVLNYLHYHHPECWGPADSEAYSNDTIYLRSIGIDPTQLPPLDSIGLGFLLKSGVPSPSTPLSSQYLASFTSSPNPFRKETTLEFTLNRMAYVTLAVYDELGRFVWGDGRGTSLEAGTHTIHLDGSALPSGTLYARIATGFGEVKTVKLVHEK
jgi:hypothetical protein